MSEFQTPLPVGGGARKEWAVPMTAGATQGQIDAFYAHASGIGIQAFAGEEAFIGKTGYGAPKGAEYYQPWAAPRGTEYLIFAGAGIQPRVLGSTKEDETFRILGAHRTSVVVDLGKRGLIKWIPRLFLLRNDQRINFDGIRGVTTTYPVGYLLPDPTGDLFVGPAPELIAFPAHAGGPAHIASLPAGIPYIAEDGRIMWSTVEGWPSGAPAPKPAISDYDIGVEVLALTLQTKEYAKLGAEVRKLVMG